MEKLLRRAALRRLVGTLGATALLSLSTSVGFGSLAHATTVAPPTYTFSGFGTVVVNGTVTDTDVLFSTYTVDAGAPCDGKTLGGAGNSCEPQTIIGVTQPIPAGTYTNQSFTTGASASCGYGQADIYTGTELTKLGSAGSAANGDHYVTGDIYTLGGACGSTPPPSTPIAPTATSASCVSGAAVPGSITLPVGNYVVTDSTGTTVTALGALAAGTYTVTATAPAGQTFLAPGATDTYVLSAGNTVATWQLTITGSGTCIPPSTPIAPTATSASCVSGAAVPGSITLPVGSYVVTDSTGTTVTALGALAAGTYTVTATAPAGQTFLAPGATDTYVLSAGNTVATWQRTITGVATCTTTYVTSPPGPAPTGSLVESCPAESTGVQSYTVTLHNALNTAGSPSTTPVQFQVRVDSSIVDTGVTSAGNTDTYTGTLPVGSASVVTAAYSTDSGTTWTPISLGSPAVTFPCVLGIQLTQSPPTAVTPPTGVQPAAVVKPAAATLPFTGLHTTAMLLLSSGLVFGGGLLLILSRRLKGSVY